MVGDPPTMLSVYKSPPGYRLTLNNIALPVAKKKRRNTEEPLSGRPLFFAARGSSPGGFSLKL